MKEILSIATHYCATIQREVVPLKRLPQLVTLMETSNTLPANDMAIELICPPVVYRSESRQFLLLNARQVVMGAHTLQLSADSRVLVRRIMDESDLPLAKLLYEVVQPAQIFGELEPLIHAAFGMNHYTALLQRHFFPQSLQGSITTNQLLLLCGNRVKKSTLNHLKKKLGYTQAQEKRRPAKTDKRTSNTSPQLEMYQ